MTGDALHQSHFASGFDAGRARAEAEVQRLQARMAAIQRLVDEQAHDDGLWFIAQTAAEAYVQQELRRLHTVIEATEDAGR